LAGRFSLGLFCGEGLNGFLKIEGLNGFLKIEGLNGFLKIEGLNGFLASDLALRPGFGNPARRDQEWPWRSGAGPAPGGKRGHVNDLV